jgi:hypothetical protein
MPILQSFLQSGQMESYQNVKVEYIQGRFPALHVFQNKVQVQVHDDFYKELYASPQEYHVWMTRDLGFSLHSMEQQQVIQRRVQKETADFNERQARRDENRRRRTERSKQNQQQQHQEL